MVTTSKLCVWTSLEWEVSRNEKKLWVCAACWNAEKLLLWGNIWICIHCLHIHQHQIMKDDWISCVISDWQRLDSFKQTIGRLGRYVLSVLQYFTREATIDWETGLADLVPSSLLLPSWHGNECTLIHRNICMDIDWCGHPRLWIACNHAPSTFYEK